MTATHQTLETDIIIAGAGPVGLTLAIALARRGVRTVVLEQKTELDARSRATLIVPRALEIIDSLQLLPSFVAQGQRNDRLHIVRASDRAPLIDFDFGVFAAETTCAFALAIPQNRTEQILLDAARASGAADVRFGHPLVHFDETDDGITVTARAAGREERVHGRYLVGADGAHSAVRTQLGWNLAGKTYPTRAFLCDVRVTPAADVQQAWLADPNAASFTLGVRFADGTWRIIESAIGDEVVEASFPARAQALTTALFGAHAWRETLWTAAYRKHERRAAQFHQGRVLLAGDAAHLNSPAGGQGLNAGLQDAHNAAWKLAELVAGRGDAARLLDSYSAERSGSFDRDVRALTDGIETMETAPLWTRRIGFSLAGLAGRLGLSTAVARRLSMLAPSYDGSPLLDGDPAIVGQRLPNYALGSGRVYDAIGERGLLLSSDPHGVAATARAAGVPVLGMPETVRRRFRHAATVFVRPDQVVGLARRAGELFTPAHMAAALGKR